MAAGEDWEGCCVRGERKLRSCHFTGETGANRYQLERSL